MEGNTVAKIALQAATYAIDKPYDYQVPPELLDTLRPGMRVVVPFGAGNRRTEGIVLALEGGYPDDPRRKSILTVLDEEPVLDGEALRLALWMRERWFCTVYDAARAMLPAGLYFSLQDRWKLAPGVDREAAMRRRAGQSTPGASWSAFASGREADVAQIKEAFGTKIPIPPSSCCGTRAFSPWKPAPPGWGTRKSWWPRWPSARRPWPWSRQGAARAPAVRRDRAAVRPRQRLG
ncbi:MAG: hypothetical protein ACLRIS_02240 [Flavonifractor plautii]